MTDETPARRHYARIPFHRGAQLVLADHVVSCDVVDLSLKGALVALEGAPAEDEDHCRLHLSLDADHEVEITMQARVAHREGRMLGMTWESIDLDSLTQLRRLLELNMGSGEAMERELAVMLNEHSRS